MSAEADIALIGAGRLGSCLARALCQAGYRVRAIASRRADSAKRLAAELPAAVDCTAERAVEHAWVFLTVGDDALAELVWNLPFVPSQRVVHCSGALPLSVLAPARARGAQVGCLHPLQSFPERTSPASRFSGITIGVEGEGGLQAELTALCAALGARSLDLTGVDRARYHAAAVIASNYVVALSAAAARAFALAGLPPELARQALSPLTRGAADNVAQLPWAQALTGPLARGDIDTVRAHLEALAAEPSLRELYRALGSELLRLPLPLGPEQRALLRGLLEPDS